MRLVTNLQVPRRDAASCRFSSEANHGAAREIKIGPAQHETAERRGAAVNSEDLNLVFSPAVAAAYPAHWKNRLAVSAPFGGRQEWCLS
jgi:hypothetical protein